MKLRSRLMQLVDDFYSDSNTLNIIAYLPTSGDLKSGGSLHSLHYTPRPPPTPPPPAPTNCLRTLYDILHEVHGIKMRFHHCNDEQNLCHWLNMCKNVPETVQWIQKVRILWKNGLNFKLKHRNGQNSILSGRFGALTRRPGDSQENWESWQVCNS